MASTIATIDTLHEDMIHDAQMDYYGKRLATCSSDRVIKIFENINDTLKHVADIKGHEGPVWQVAWAHPKFGNIIASCSYDRKIFIWRENTANVWTKVYEYAEHDSSVNSIAFAPHEFGLILAGASSDGCISIIYNKDDKWETQKIPRAHQIGCNAVSWAPAISAGSLVNSNGMSNMPVKRLVSGGCDNLVKIWKEFDKEWKTEEVLEGHNDWVRDVAWAPGIGLPTNTIASCSQDQTVIIWTQSEDGTNWSKYLLPKFPDVVWRVSWSIAGNILAVSTGDQNVTLWKESLNGEWKLISQMNESTGTTQEKN